LWNKKGKMNRKPVIGVILALLLTSMLTLIFYVQSIQSVRATGTIYIRADGSVELMTAPIQQDGNVYTFTDDIYDSIVVERDNIVIAGSGCTVEGTGAYDSKGISLSQRSNITIKNVEIKTFGKGIHLYESSNNTIFESNITNNDYGIMLEWSSNNIVSGNIITNTNLVFSLM
jgi:parallel beta-helix repeat protein